VFWASWVLTYFAIFMVTALINTILTTKGMCVRLSGLKTDSLGHLPHMPGWSFG
jgi:hypothetical protein